MAGKTAHTPHAAASVVFVCILAIAVNESKVESRAALPEFVLLSKIKHVCGMHKVVGVAAIDLADNVHVSAHGHVVIGHPASHFVSLGRKRTLFAVPLRDPNS